MKNDKIEVKSNREKAIEIFATNPNIEVKKAAELLGVHVNTVSRMRTDPNFHEQVLARFNLELEGGLPNMLKALERECLAGNTNALKLMLEYLNKLQKNINVVVLSPFEKWMKAQETKNDSNDIEEAELVEDMPEFKELPPRTDKNNHLVIHKERLKVKNAPKKERSLVSHNKTRREQYKWVKRAEAVGVAKLSAKRPTPYQKKAWQEKIIAKEKQAS